MTNGSRSGRRCATGSSAAQRIDGGKTLGWFDLALELGEFALGLGQLFHDEDHHCAILAALQALAVLIDDVTKLDGGFHDRTILLSTTKALTYVKPGTAAANG